MHWASSIEDEATVWFELCCVYVIKAKDYGHSSPVANHEIDAL
jgi:hypothetical protein